MAIETSNTKEDFWDRRILHWERSRYQSKYFPNRHLLKRFEFASDWVSSQLDSNSGIVDLGCGSGLFINKLLSMNIIRFSGVDFSKAAIDFAKTKNQDSRVSYICQNVLDYAPKPNDLILGLGLLDWLTEAEIKKLFSKNRQNKFLFSYSRSEKSIFQRAHNLFVSIRSKIHHEKYRPAYHFETELKRIYPGGDDIYFYSSPDLGLVGFVSNCPFPKA